VYCACVRPSERHAPSRDAPRAEYERLFLGCPAGAAWGCLLALAGLTTSGGFCCGVAFQALRRAHSRAVVLFVVARRLFQRLIIINYIRCSCLGAGAALCVGRHLRRQHECGGHKTARAFVKRERNSTCQCTSPVAMSLSAALYGLQHTRRCRGAGAQQQRSRRRLGGAQEQSTRPRAAVDAPPPPRRDKTVAMPRRRNGDTEPSVPPTPRCAQGVLPYKQVPVPKSNWPV
jgi:hypothetical protein